MKMGTLRDFGGPYLESNFTCIDIVLGVQLGWVVWLGSSQLLIRLIYTRLEHDSLIFTLIFSDLIEPRKKSRNLNRSVKSYTNKRNYINC